MNLFKFWMAALVGVLLLPGVAASADSAEEAIQKGLSGLKQQDCDAAMAAFTEAVLLDPRDARLYFARGITYGHKGQYDKAIADYSEAVRLNPKDSVPHNGLAWLLATCPEVRIRDGKRAIDPATQACDLTKWKEWGDLDTLAAAYAEAGNFDKAVEFQLKALEMATKDADKKECRKHLKLYGDGKPYRESMKKK